MEVGDTRANVMTPGQVQLLRRLALNEREAINAVMSGELIDREDIAPDTVALVRVAALLSTDSDPATFRWAIEEGFAAGVEDIDLFNTLLIVAPIIGTARLTAALPHLMEALDLEIVDV